MESVDFDLLRFLDWLATEANLKRTLRSEVQTLRLQTMFLKVILSCRGKWHIEDANLKLLLTRIETVFQDAEMELRRLWADLKRPYPDYLVLIRRRSANSESSLPNLATDDLVLLSGALERLQLLTPDIRQVYTILSKSSRCISDVDDEAAAETLDFLEWAMKYLLRYKAHLFASVKEELKAIREGLILLRNFIRFATKRCSKIGKLKYLLIHAEFAVGNISCLLYLCSVNEKMNDQKVKEMKMQLSSELQKLTPAQPEVREIYIEALKTSKSELGVFDWNYLDSFLKCVLKLSSMTCNRSQITFLYGEVQFPGTFLDESSAQDQMCNFFRERISAVIIDITCAIIYLLPNSEQNRDEVREVKVAVYDLQHIFMVERENATKASYLYLRTPWRFLGPNAWRELGSQLEFLEKQLKDKLIGPLKDQIELVREELKPLKKVLTASQSNLHEELEIQRRRLIHIIDHTNLVITSFKYRAVTLWSCKLELYYIIQKIRLIKLEVRDINRFTDTQPNNGSKKLHILSILGMLEFEDQLRCLEINMDLISPLKDEVQILRLKASFLRVFLSCRGKWHIEDGNLKVILTRIQTVFQNSDLRTLWAECIQIESTECWSMPMNMAHVLSSMQEKLQLLNPDIQEVYTKLSKSSRFITGMTDEAITESLNTLQENIEDLLRFNAELVCRVKEELEAMEKCLRFFRDFLYFTAKRCSKIGKLKDLLIHAEILVDNISCLLFLSFVNDKLDDQMVKEMKMQLSSELQKFSPAQPNVRDIYMKALKASNSAQGNSILVDKFDWSFLDSLRNYILVLSDTKKWSTTPIRDQILLLYEDLPFLITYLAMDLSLEEHTENDHQIFKDLLERTSVAINETSNVIGLLHNDKQNEIYKKFSVFLARKFYNFYFPRSFRSRFPRTDGEGFVSHVLENLKELLNTKVDLVAPLEHQIKIVQEELLSVREDFSKTAKQTNQYEELQGQWTRVTETAYVIEYVVDSFVAGCGPLSYNKLGLLNVVEEIKAIKMELKAIKNKITDDKSVHMPPCFPSQFSTEPNTPKVDAVMSSKQRLAEENYNSELMIFPEETKEIVEQLICGSEKLNFLTIVGMPGIGKTTLANSVFQDSLVTRHFHVRARCCVSQVYDKRRLLHEILQEVTAESDHCKDDDLDEKLYKSLKGRRYLIFIDDIWDIQPWKEIKISFPDDGKGSRILFTTRFDYIASQAGPEGINYPLSPLPEEKSWKLLESRIFGGGSCPTDLVNLGRKIAANSKGLPLTIDLIAGILRGKEMIIREWKKVADSMKEYLHDPQGRCQKVLELSYQNLPNELRPCFLYFAAFPEDTNIRTRELISLWIAEGFVQLQKDDRKCLEDAAEEILNNLISRSLVIISKRRLGEVKATRIHDLLHNFASAKAEEERFMLKIDDSTLSCYGYQWRGQYRLCIYPGYWDDFLGSNPSGTRARTLICSEDPPTYSSSLQLSYFKLLRVLYIPKVTFRHHPTAIFRLIHLRFLAIFSSEENILSEIHELQNLETFVMNNDFYDKCLFLDEICNIMRLRHLCVRRHVSIRCRNEKFLEKSFLFDNLRTLYRVAMSYADDIEMIFKLMPNLVKLKVLFYNPDGGCYPFPKLNFLKKLESLEVINDSREYPCKIVNFPPYLKTLVLSNFWVPWAEISEIGNLEYLEILKLQNGAFKGAIWDMNDGQFPKLKYLSLNKLDIEEWNATEDHLSGLKQLHVGNCWELKELPLCLAEVATLEKINLYCCCSSVASSAKIIKEEQEAVGNYQLVVHIEGTFGDDEEE